MPPPQDTQLGTVFGKSFIIAKIFTPKPVPHTTSKKDTTLGIGLPFVGYVAATSHGANAAAKANKNKRAEVDTFIGMVRIAFLDGWADSIVPSGFKYSSTGEGQEIAAKNFSHKIFLDTDLERRPELLKAIEFLKSDPEGGTLCIISDDDIKKATGMEIENFDGKEAYATRRMRSAAQCYAIRELEHIPIVECGRRKDSRSVVSRFARIPMSASSEEEKSQMVEKLINEALRAWSANLKRLENAHESCILSRVGDMVPDQRQEVLQDVDTGLACEKCASKLRGPLTATRS